MAPQTRLPDLPRRNVLRLGVRAAALAGLAPALPALMGRARGAEARKPILVALELSGGNDGLNTVVPYHDDRYYALRPKLGLRPEVLRPIDERYGFNAGMAGLERLYKDGKVAVVHGCGYAQPSFSHFNSMAFWHTAAPNSGAADGWMGRLADELLPPGTPNPIVNIDATASLAVRSKRHVPTVFDDPERFMLKGGSADAAAAEPDPNWAPSRRLLHQVDQSARDASQFVREAWAEYRSPIDYGLTDLDLRKIVALMEAGLSSQLYYTAFRNNAFDTHVYQPNLHGRLLTYFSDAVAGFHQDLERIGMADDVVVLVFSEFGRRAAENTNLGTDHGTANVMFVIGNAVRGGHYGTPPDLADLDETDNLKFTTDFRHVYASVIEDWLGLKDTSAVLNGKFEPIPVFG